ncbi:MAG: hypothetical protein KDB14_04890 [Planctomycetales bacterium]|nr:hypothetical protein [Planctomycetales bacterium]MCA9227680.1 hypothetical protein [Planctomycetales bacterium]
MRRIFSCFLIGTVLLSHCLALLSHAHPSPLDGTGQHASPHVHLDLGHHHHGATHHHDDAPVDISHESSDEGAPIHDDGAVYLSPDGLVATSVKPVPSCELASMLAGSISTSHVGWAWTDDELADAPALSRPKCALFLQLLCIRC